MNVLFSSSVKERAAIAAMGIVVCYCLMVTNCHANNSHPDAELTSHIAELSSTGMSKKVARLSGGGEIPSQEQVLEAFSNVLGGILKQDNPQTITNELLLKALNSYMADEGFKADFRLESINGESQLCLYTPSQVFTRASMLGRMEDDSTGGTTCTSANNCTKGTCTKTQCTKQSYCTEHSDCTKNAWCTKGFYCTKSLDCTDGVKCTAGDNCTGSATACTEGDWCTAGGNCTNGGGCTEADVCSDKAKCTMGSGCSTGTNCTNNGECSKGAYCTGGTSCSNGDGSQNHSCTSGDPSCTSGARCSAGTYCTSGQGCSTMQGCSVSSQLCTVAIQGCSIGMEEMGGMAQRILPAGALQVLSLGLIGMLIGGVGYFSRPSNRHPKA